MRAYWGLTEDFDCKQLICSDPSMNKISFISKELSDYLYTDALSSKLDIINMGVPLFQRNNSRFGGTDCIYRVLQSGVINLVPYMTKRIVKTDCLELLKELL